MPGIVPGAGVTGGTRCRILHLMAHILVRAAKKENKWGEVTALGGGWSGKASLSSLW